MRYGMPSSGRAVRGTGLGWCCVLLLAAAAVGCSEQLTAANAADDEGSATLASALTLDPPIVISQLFGGGGNAGAPYQNDFVELFNRSDIPVALDGLSLQYASATGSGNFGASAASLVTFPQAATLDPGKYYLIQLAGSTAAGAALPTPDLGGQAIAVSSSAGKLALVTGSTSLGCNGGSAPCSADQEARIVDLVGFGNANYFEGSAVTSLSNSRAAIRRDAGCADSNVNRADFEVQAPAPRNGATPAAVCGKAPGADASVPPLEDAGTPSPADAGAAPGELIAVHSVQGAAHVSPYQGQLVQVGPAIVTALRANGFYMQDPAPDADDATSEGIFVYTSAAPSVEVGARITVQATVSEFRPGCTPTCGATSSAFDNLSITELTAPAITLLDTGNALPAAVVLGAGPGQRAVPRSVICDDAPGNVENGGAFDPANDGIDFYESLEGMRVQLDHAQVIDPTRTQSGETTIGVLARADAGLRTGRGGILATESDFNPERIFLSDAIQPGFPSVVVGDALSGAVVGVIDYSFANYRLIATQPLPAVAAGGLAQETTELVASTPTQLTIASMNVENLDPSDPPEKLSALAKIVVDHLRSPDLIALEEVQDNNGAQNNAEVDASTTLRLFIEAILSAGGPRYEFRQIDPQNNQDGGEPGGNIRVVFLFRSDRGLAFVDRGSAGATDADSVDSSSGAPHLALSPGRVDPGNSAWSSSRKPLAGELTFAGKTLFVVGNHFNSKGGDDPLFGRMQPPVLSSETQREQQATALASFVDAILRADPQAWVVALGDFNDFSFSKPLKILQEQGLVDMIHTLPENERYTYLFQGNSQDLDHILVSPALAPRASYDVVHVNAEFAVQASDHEPAVVRLDLGEASTEPPPSTAPDAGVSEHESGHGDGHDHDHGHAPRGDEPGVRPLRAALLWSELVGCVLFPRFCRWH